MKQETPSQREKRKKNYLSITVMRSAQGLEPEELEKVLLEAGRNWEEKNPI